MDRKNIYWLFRIIIIAFIILSILSCAVRIFSHSADFYNLFEITGYVFWIIIFFGMHYLCNNKGIKAPWLTLCALFAVELVIDISFMLNFEPIIFVVLVGIVILTRDVIMIICGAKFFSYHTQGGVVRQTGVIFIIFAIVDILMTLFMFCTKQSISNPHTRVMIMNLSMLVTTIIEVYLLFCIQKLFISKKAYEEDFEARIDETQKD